MKILPLVKFIPAILWMSFIFYLSSRSTAGVGYTGFERFLLFKTLHLIEYAVLAILIYYPLKKYPPAIVYSYLYAITDEIHQGFTPGRGPKFTDTLIDLAGILIGVFILRLIHKSYIILHKSK
ncbi:VanZ family protein [Candidatus Shapirobacteria bacterium]|nr:VanZ family protein [Candidatus Shapirobacteria bacterium]